MDRCALFVDAGYLLADGAMAVHGTRNRDSVSWDYAGLVQLLNEVARDRTGLPMLRCYWYEATVEGRRSQEQDSIADIPGVKFRAVRIRPGRREGVENYVQRDLTTLARTGGLCDAVLVSGDEDMSQVVSDVQDLGVRVTVVHVSVEGNWTIARALRRECDDLVEIGAGHLRPYVNLLAGGGAEHENVPAAPLSNGRPRPENKVMSRQPVAARADASGVGPRGPDVMYSNSGPQHVTGGTAMDQLRAMQQSIAQGRGGDHLAPQGTAPVMEPRSGPNPGHGPGPGPGPGHGPAAQNDMGGFQPPERAPTGGHPALSPGHPGHPGGPPPNTGGHLPPSAPTGAHPSMALDPGGGPPPNPMGPVSGPHLSMRGAQDGGYHGGPPPDQTHPPGRPPTGAHRAPGADMTGPYQMDGPPNARGAPPGPEAHYRPNTGENPGYGGNAGPNPTIGASTGAESGSADAVAPEPPRSVSGPVSGDRLTPGPHTNPTPRIGYIAPGATSLQSMDDAIQVAHREGTDFGATLARDAPALWLEAVLAGRPHMPSDLEARLLQGSALPVDHLLRDEVRETLRAGFWDALERTRG